MKSLLFVLYDGIQNSVFYSQVLMPLQNHLRDDRDLHITIISFEKKIFSRQELQKIIPECDLSDRLHTIVLKKIPYIGVASLWYAARRIKKALNFTENFTNKDLRIFARGPFAGWIVLRALRSLKKNIPVTIQARGLAAEEFAYVMSHKRALGIKNRITRLFQKYFYRSYKKIERYVYGKSPNISIEAVSPALKEYLEQEFGADEKTVTVSYRDIPPKISQEQVRAWRDKVRIELNIKPDRYVYCYTGSARPWQQVDEMVAFARQTCAKNKNAFFFFFSADTEIFKKKLEVSGLSPDLFLVKEIHPDETYRYLSAADAGLLFRDNHPVNFVARPTKMLEYLSVGLKIVHNNSVCWLSKAK